MTEASASKLLRLESQVSVDAAPDLREYYKGPVVQETSLSTKDVSMDALPRNDPAPLQMRNRATDSSLHLQPVQNISQGDSKISSSSASSDAVNLQGYGYVYKNVQDKIQSYIDSKDESSFEDSLSFSTSESCSSMGDNWLQDLEVYEKYMPPDIKIGYYDVMVLYSDDNQSDADKFCKHLKSEINLKSEKSVKAVLYDCEELTSLAGSRLGHLEKALERCTYVFIYMTKEFCEDKWMELSSEECLMKAIYDDEKRWCVVPVYTVSRRSAKFKIPMGLNSLKGINYYNNDQFYRNGVSRLIEDKLYQRLKNEKKHQEKQFKWLQELKRKFVTDEENRRRLEHMEKQKSDRHIMEELRRTEEFLNKDLNQYQPMDTSDLGKYFPAMHHSYSEPGLQNKFNNIPLSASSGCLIQIDYKGQPYFDGNINPNSYAVQSPYNMAAFERAVIGNANILVDPFSRMTMSAMNGNPPPYSSQVSSPPQYCDVVAARQAQPSQQGQIQSLWCNQQDRTQPTQYSQQAPTQMYQQNPNFLPTSIQQIHNQMSYTQSVMNNQQTQNELDFTHQQILNESGLSIQQLDQTGTQNTGLRTDSNMQQTVNQADVRSSALYLQGGKPIGIPLRNTVGQGENNIVGGDPRSQPHREPHSHGNETPSNNSTVSADQLSQFGSTNEMEPTHECLPDLSVLDQNPESSDTVSCHTGNDSIIQEGGGLPNFDVLSLPPDCDGRSLTSVESVGSQITPESQSHGSKKMPLSQSEKNTSCSTPTPTDNKVTDIAESGTETIRKTGEGGEKVIIHHHYHYYDKERDNPKVINIYAAKNVQIGDSPAVTESKEGQKKSKSSKELPVQKEKTEVKCPATLQDVTRKEIEDEESQSSVTGIAELKVAHTSVVNQHDSKQSQDCMSLASKTSPELKHSLLNNKDNEKREEEPYLRIKSKDHDEYVRAEKEDEQDASIPKVSIVRNIEKKNMPTDLGTRPKASKPVAKVPPSPSVAQNPPFKKDMGNDNEETDLKTVDRKQSDDTGLKTVHETGTGTVHDTQTESEETSLKLAAPSRAKNRASPVREIPQTDLSQYQATIQQRATNRASPVREGSQTDLSQYQAAIQQRATNRASPFREGSQTDLSQYQAAIQQRATNRASPVRERQQTDLSQYQATIPQMATNRAFPVKERPQTNLGLFQANTSSTDLLFSGASRIAAASSLRNDATSAHHVQSGEDSSSQDELDCETFPDGGPPKSEGFIPNPQGDREEWHYVETDSFDANDSSVDGFSNKRRMKKPNSSSTDNKSCTVS